MLEKRKKMTMAINDTVYLWDCLDLFVAHFARLYFSSENDHCYLRILRSAYLFRQSRIRQMSLLYVNICKIFKTVNDVRNISSLLCNNKTIISNHTSTSLMFRISSFKYGDINL